MVLREQTLFAERTFVRCCRCHSWMAIVTFIYQLVPVLVPSCNSSVDSRFVAYEMWEAGDFTSQTFVTKSCGDVWGFGTCNRCNRVTRALCVQRTFSASIYQQCWVLAMCTPLWSYSLWSRNLIHVVRERITVDGASCWVSTCGTGFSVGHKRSRTLVSCLALDAICLSSSGIETLFTHNGWRVTFWTSKAFWANYLSMWHRPSIVSTCASSWLWVTRSWACKRCITSRACYWWKMRVIAHRSSRTQCLACLTFRIAVIARRTRCWRTIGLY